LSPHARVLDVGCGAGRLEIGLAARVEKVVGLEASAAMASAARRRCCDLANVEIAVCEGGLPPALDDASFDLAIAVDAFPYILQSGDALAARWFDAVGRALTSEGDFVILNFSYRGDLSRDVEQAAEFGRERSMRPIALGAAPFQHWDGVAFHFKKELSPASAGTSPSRCR
jgi:cyclopropane fatty-acyl-phospholipid synthase-like methyltransferase